MTDITSILPAFGEGDRAASGVVEGRTFRALVSTSYERRPLFNGHVSFPVSLYPGMPLHHARAWSPSPKTGRIR